MENLEHFEASTWQHLAIAEKRENEKRMISNEQTIKFQEQSARLKWAVQQNNNNKYLNNTTPNNNNQPNRKKHHKYTILQAHNESHAVPRNCKYY